MTIPKRGEIFSCSLDPTVGSEQRGTRPVIVVSTDPFNEALPLTTIVPVTTLRRDSERVYPSEALIPQGVGGLRSTSLAMCHHVRTVARARLTRRIGSLPPEVMAMVDGALAVHLQLERPVQPGPLGR